MHRFTQEIIFGKAAYQLLKKLDIVPDILHLNEAHTVVAAAHVRADDAFSKTAITFTNHTIAKGTLEYFEAEKDLHADINRAVFQFGISPEKHEAFRKVFTCARSGSVVSWACGWVSAEAWPGALGVAAPSAPFSSWAARFTRATASRCLHQLTPRIRWSAHSHRALTR